MKMFRFAGDAARVALVCLAVMCGAGVTRAEEPLRGEALLVWGTNDPQSPDPHHKPVDAELAHKLGACPYKWKYYFEVSRQPLEVPVGAAKKNISMSKHCVLDVANLGKDLVEVKLYGEGKPVSTNKERLLEHGTLIFGGSAGNDTAWLVVIRRAKFGPINTSAAK